MSDDPTLRLHTIVLAALRQAGPQPLARGLGYWAQGVTPAPDTTEEGFRDRLLGGYAGHPLVELWRRAVTAWDFAGAPAWSTSPPCTDARRADIYALLALDERTRKVLTELVPVAVADAPTVISTEFTPWYTPAAQQSRNWYWPAYERVLERKGWHPEALAALDEATDRVVERLANPATGTVYQSKGLVVGHVQSGKTANFTGVIAKAIDSGYRLVIVLAGTLNLLRQQTQRRLDMELVGRENILRGGDEIESDYADDPEWHRGGFLTHGGLPSVLGAFDIMRMTTRDNDYKRLLQGITALEFEKQEPALPLHDPRNLHRSAARLMVVKKNKTVLTKLLGDLKKIRTPLAEIPVLIIDDESDQASVNTSDPRKLREGKAERTAINGLVSSLLAQLPRAQYVGYTATPFANVFIDPSDTADIFPKDFIVSLPAPPDYMGIRAFHDLDSGIPWSERTYANSQGKAHVRDIPPTSGEADGASLQQAMDAFVLSAAIKLYRERHDPRDVSYPHHTMLVHESVRTADHRALAERLTAMWHSAGYLGPIGHARLRALFETDFAPVSAARHAGYATPASFAEVAEHIGAAYIRIGGDENPVLVVNSDKDIEQGTADFDKRSLWKILVGGAKLSRGFTVEGLTISYYRRTTTQADTLMQMGRWFGFRKGYRDLVRLYISRGEAYGRKEIDLYDAFEAVCRDEESFRAELDRYAPLIDGKPQVTPAQVPPLVAQHLPWLKPTSANKMYNAELIEIRSPGTWIEPAAYAGQPASVRRNAQRWQPLLAELGGADVPFTNPPDSSSALVRRFPARTTMVGHGRLVSVLESLEWSRPDLFQPHLTYLKQLDGRLARVDDWLLVAPQLVARDRLRATIIDSPPLSLAQRSKAPFRDSFSRVTGFEHRVAAERLIAEAGRPGSLVNPSQGVALLYPVLDITGDRPVHDAITDGAADASRVIMAFALLPPRSAIDTKRRLVHFRAKISALRDAPIVDVREAPADR
ncbi:Z1 domain-containing protein [Streptomyces sp. AC536]|uniref:Z1 domain-containing protein n=1 Tax=Streptomyces buecherae TaxID=2763006 RepID=UPI00164E22F2|nr:Z1 domain-containing protein [Streptomyces buecherae]MBC3985871.1 Z1 domain-containing protein [Streptomyces buecherae]QNJ40885.1 Z1 domain-containing protein [Streptomyces buecherae]